MLLMLERVVMKYEACYVTIYNLSCQNFETKHIVVLIFNIFCMDNKNNTSICASTCSVVGFDCFYCPRL